MQHIALLPSEGAFQKTICGPSKDRTTFAKECSHSSDELHAACFRSSASNAT